MTAVSCNVSLDVPELKVHLTLIGYLGQDWPGPLGGWDGTSIWAREISAVLVWPRNTTAAHKLTKVHPVTRIRSSVRLTSLIPSLIAYVTRRTS